MTEMTTIGLNAFVAVVQLLALFVMYYLASKQYRMNKSSQYLERFSHHDFVELRNFIDDYIEGRKDNLGSDSFVGPPDFKHDRDKVIAFANFFNELAIAYFQNLADKKYTREVFSFLVQHYWDNLTHWVNDYRELRARKSLFSDWERLCHEFRNREGKQGVRWTRWFQASS